MGCVGCVHEYKISVFMGNDNPYAALWTLIGAKLFAREDGTSPLIGSSWSNSVNNETMEITAEVRKALGFEDIVRFEHHLCLPQPQQVRQIPLLSLAHLASLLLHERAAWHDVAPP
jgi:hypothetical protein